MRGRGKAGYRSVKNRRRRISKVRKAPAARARTADLQARLDSYERELREAREAQAATSEVLKVISRSTFDLQTVLDTLVESATRLCGADYAWLFQRDGELVKFSASFGNSAALHARIRDYFQGVQVHMDRGSVSGRAAREGRVVHVTDVLADSEYTYGGVLEIAGYRAALGVPLLH